MAKPKHTYRQAVRLAERIYQEFIDFDPNPINRAAQADRCVEFACKYLGVKVRRKRESKPY